MEREIKRKKRCGRKEEESVGKERRKKGGGKIKSEKMNGNSSHKA